jgi:hypothetical protein
MSVIADGGVELSGVQDAAFEGLNGILAWVKDDLRISYRGRAMSVGTHMRMSSTYMSIAYGVGEIRSYNSGVWVLAVE